MLRRSQRYKDCRVWLMFDVRRNLEFVMKNDDVLGKIWKINAFDPCVLAWPFEFCFPLERANSTLPALLVKRSVLVWNVRITQMPLQTFKS